MNNNLIGVVYYMVTLLVNSGSNYLYREVDSPKQYATTSEEHSEYITISVFRVHTMMDDMNIYERCLKFKCLNTSFKIFLRRYSVFVPNVDLSIGSDEKLEMPNNMRKYTPISYIGYIKNSPLSDIIVTVTDKLFEAHILFENFSYFIECPNNAKHRDDGFQHLQFSLKKCRICKLSELKSSVLFDADTDIYQTRHQTYKPILQNDSYLSLGVGEVIKSRAKRKLPTQPIAGNCVLKIMIDHSYFEMVGSSDISRTIAQMSVSVTEADLILRATDFDGDGAGDNIGLQIGSITIYDRHSEYTMKDDGIDPYAYIHHMSEYDFSRYCLAVGFTHRDFKNSIAGLAWIASSSVHGGMGGICQQNAWNLTKKSTNVVLVSRICLGKSVTPTVAGLILAHEIGHSFGSIHDSTDDSICSPGGNFGNYLMHSKTSDGSRSNHRRYSPCSINSMYPVLVNRAPTCFVKDIGSVCGDMVVEGSEECDCGTASTCDLVDPCCTPAGVGNSSLDVPCSVRKSLGFQCSPSTSECCTGTCMYVSAAGRVQCRSATECGGISFCEPDSPSCPDSPALPNWTHCDGGRRTCINGTCSRSICDSLGLRECQCSNTLHAACYVCCAPGNGSRNCSQLNTYNSELSGVLKRRGDACFNSRGFCTESGHCALKDADGDDILHTFLDSMAADHIGEWFKKYWYFVLVGVLVSTLVAVVLSLCFKDKPDVTVDAMRMGKLSKVMALAETQKAVYRDRIEECEVLFQRISDQITPHRSHQSLTEAVGRLSVLFPTAPVPLVVKTAQACSSEEVAVKMLLLRNFPIRRFRVTHVDANICR